jgi:hypothetical protein
VQVALEGTDDASIGGDDDAFAVDLRNLPKVVTREWVMEEILAANKRTHSGIATLDVKYENKLRKMVDGVCPAMITDPTQIADLVYWLLGQVEGIDSMKEGASKRFSPTRERNRRAFASAFERIGRALEVIKEGKHMILSGEVSWPRLALDVKEDEPEYREWSQQRIAASVMESVRDTIKKFLKRNASLTAANPELRSALHQFTQRMQEALDAFLEDHCADPIASKATMYSIEGFLEECTFCLEEFTRSAGLPHANTLYSQLQHRIDDAYTQALQIFTLRIVKAFNAHSNKTYPPPALIREPWSPKEPEQKISSAETYWNGLIDSRLVTYAQALVEHCFSAGIIFPSARRAGEARIMLRHMFGALRGQCAGAIARTCADQSYGPHAMELADAVTSTIMDLHIPDNCPKPLREAFAICVQQPLFDGFADGGKTLIAEDRSSLHTPEDSWEQELEGLFTSREAMPATEAAELQKSIEPVKHSFATTMLRNMLEVVERRPSGETEQGKIFAVSARNFSATWIPIIRDAVAQTVDAQATQQTARGTTIQDFLRKNFSTVRQRTIFLRAASAAEARLKVLRDQAPTEALLTAMRKMIEPAEIDVLLDMSQEDIPALIANELLGPRDSSLLPGERSLLRQFCNNTLDFQRPLEPQMEENTAALEQLASECMRSFHAGFPYRTLGNCGDCARGIFLGKATPRD